MKNTVRLKGLWWIGMVLVVIPGMTYSAEEVNNTFSQAAFEAADQNKDGVIDEAEYVSDFVAGFVALDDDKDRKIHKEELANHDPKSFADSDINQDGYLSLDEVMDTKLEDFDAADANNDGVLSLQEVTQYDVSKITKK
jgi:Ca2+-binding EF-hand superfamily protein